MSKRRSGTRPASGRRYTLSTIKHLNHSVGGHFFDRDTMKFFGDTMSSFKVVHEGSKVFIERKRTGKRWQFNTTTYHIGPV